MNYRGGPASLNRKRHCTQENNTTMTISNFEAHKYKRWIYLVRGFSNHCTTNVHKWMEKNTKVWWWSFQNNDEQTTPQAFVSKIQQSDDAFTQTDRFSTFTIYIQSFRRTRYIKNDAIEFTAQIRGRDGDTLGMGKNWYALMRKYRHKEIKGILLVNRIIAFVIITAVVRG